MIIDQNLIIGSMKNHLEEASSYIFAHFLHRLSFLEAKRRKSIEMFCAFAAGALMLYMLCLLCL